MISAEVIRRYPFFSMLTEDQRQAIAMIAEEKSFPKGTLILSEDKPAKMLYLLLDGEVDLVYSGGGEGAVVNAPVGSIAPGEVFGVSSLIEPFIYISSVQAASDIRTIAIDAPALLSLCEGDAQLGFNMMRNTATAVQERLKHTLVELAAARS